MSEKRKPSYWAVLPATIRYDPNLPPNAKLLYAEISALCDEHGYCFAHNSYFAKNFEWNDKSVTRHLKTLADHGYIVVNVIRDSATNEVIERRIFAGINPAGCMSPPSPQNCGVEQSNGFNNNPHTPKGGRRKRKEPREAPDWKPERFAGLWQFYPKKGRKNKQAAMDAWDKLHPDDALIDTIARALVKLTATEDWKRGIGIPYVATFLNGARWKDADELDTPDNPSGSDGGWAEDEEVL